MFSVCEMKVNVSCFLFQVDLLNVNGFERYSLRYKRKEMKHSTLREKKLLGEKERKRQASVLYNLLFFGSWIFLVISLLDL